MAVVVRISIVVLITIVALIFDLRCGFDPSWGGVWEGSGGRVFHFFWFFFFFSGKFENLGRRVQSAPVTPKPPKTPSAPKTHT